MAKINKLFNGSAAAPWIRLLIQVIVLTALVCVAYGRIDSRVDTNAANITDNKEQWRAAEIRSEIYRVNVITRLSRIEGALGVETGVRK
ncbi:MAG: hypothetical protein KAV00_06905 [Phycisphaerae bacterium]|nr:hypothetical protein [Phycisphaerae bacterium]